MQLNTHARENEITKNAVGNRDKRHAIHLILR